MMLAAGTRVLVLTMDGDKAAGDVMRVDRVTAYKDYRAAAGRGAALGAGAIMGAGAGLQDTYYGAGPEILYLSPRARGGGTTP